jgi:hypothetical protein
MVGITNPLVQSLISPKGALAKGLTPRVKNDDHWQCDIIHWVTLSCKHLTHDSFRCTFCTNNFALGKANRFVWLCRFVSGPIKTLASTKSLDWIYFRCLQMIIINTMRRKWELERFFIFILRINTTSKCSTSILITHLRNNTELFLWHPHNVIQKSQLRLKQVSSAPTEEHLYMLNSSPARPTYMCVFM